MQKSFRCFLFSFLFFLSAAFAASDNQAINQQLQAMQTQLNQQNKEIQTLNKKLQEREKLVPTETLKRLNLHTRREAGEPAEFIRVYSPEELQAQKQAQQPEKKKEAAPQKKNKLEFSYYGQITPAFMYSNDGHGTNGYLVTNDVNPSLIGGFATIHLNPALKVGANVEIGLLANPSDGMSQVQSATDRLDLRKAQTFIRSDKWGSIWFGKGRVSGDGMQHVDLSGTMLAGYASVSDIGGDLLLYDNSTHSLSAISISEVFTDLNTHSREVRFRYDTPRWKGFHFSVSAMQNNNEDAALTYEKQFKLFKLAGATSWTSPQDINADPDVVHGPVWDGSVSALFNNGINGTFALGKLISKTTGRDDPHFWYGKLGYQHHWFSPGKTFLSVDCGRYDEYLQNNDKGKTYGAEVVQGIDAWDLSVYAGYRHFVFDRPGSDFGNMQTFITGVFFSF